jgi:phospholipid/cholesterol/gamma-HCH transport system substrate-binding protein
MKSKEIQQNVKLGIFVLSGLALFFAAVVLVGSENNVFNKTFTTNAIFKNVEGLKEGDNVWLSGVKIGTVREVRIVKEGRVVVSLNLKNNQNKFIKKNATAFIGSDGLVGSKIVVIRPGDSNEIIQDTDTIGAFSPADTQDLFNIAKDVGENTRSLTYDLKVLSKRISDGQGIIGELLKEGEFARDLRTSANQIRNTTTQTARASEELHAMLYKLNHGNGLVNTLATDTSLSYVFDETLKNVRAVSRNSAEMSKGLEQLISKMNSSNNAIGVLLADTLFADRLKLTLENAQSASAKLDENMEALQHNFLLRGYFRRKDRNESKGNK